MKKLLIPVFILASTGFAAAGGSSYTPPSIHIPSSLQVSVIGQQANGNYWSTVNNVAEVTQAKLYHNSGAQVSVILQQANNNKYSDVTNIATVQQITP